MHIGIAAGAPGAVTSWVFANLNAWICTLWASTCSQWHRDFTVSSCDCSSLILTIKSSSADADAPVKPGATPWSPGAGPAPEAGAAAGAAAAAALERRVRISSMMLWKAS